MHASLCVTGVLPGLQVSVVPGPGVDCESHPISGTYGCNSRPPRRPSWRSPPTRTGTATVITTATLTRTRCTRSTPGVGRGCFVYPT
jgi:hypothetical protein